MKSSVDSYSTLQSKVILNRVQFYSFEMLFLLLLGFVNDSWIKFTNETNWFGRLFTVTFISSVHLTSFKIQQPPDGFDISNWKLNLSFGKNNPNKMDICVGWLKFHCQLLWAKSSGASKGKIRSLVIWNVVANRNGETGKDMNSVIKRCCLGPE
jgi:hypothetical protein